VTKPRTLASITTEQGIALIDQMLLDIKARPSLLRSEFGKSVRFKLTGIRASIEDGAAFTRPMELALENWNYAIHRNHPLDGEDTLQ
jgi:hypothetical protein